MSQQQQSHAPSTHPPAPLPAEHETHLLDRLAVLYKYRYPAIGLFAAVIAWSMVDSYTTIPTYRATARIQIDEETVGIGTPPEIAQNFVQPDPEVFFNTQYRIIQGRELGHRVVKKLNLSQVPEFNGQGPKPTALAENIATIKRIAMWPVRAVLGQSTQAPAPRPTPSSPQTVLTDDLARVDAFTGRVGVSPVRGSRLVDVTFDSTDPMFAVRAVNVVVDEYVAQNLELKLESLDKSLTWLTEEVGRQALQVQSSERALAEYREQKDAGALADNQNIVIARLNALNNDYTQARNLRIAKGRTATCCRWSFRAQWCSR
jgi:uncharacterized protein involved in exopolysaccharide biosynthesis